MIVRETVDAYTGPENDQKRVCIVSNGLKYYKRIMTYRRPTDPHV